METMKPKISLNVVDAKVAEQQDTYSQFFVKKDGVTPSLMGNLSETKKQMETDCPEVLAKFVALNGGKKLTSIRFHDLLICLAKSVEITVPEAPKGATATQAPVQATQMGGNQ